MEKFQQIVGRYNDKCLVFGDPNKMLPYLVQLDAPPMLGYSYSHDYGNYTQVEVRALRYCIVWYVIGRTEIGSVPALNSQATICDSMAYLQLLFRNNYLPRIEALMLVNDNYFRDIVDLYFKIYKQSNQHLISKGKLNQKFLGDLLIGMEEEIKRDAEKHERFVNYDPLLEDWDYQTWCGQVKDKLDNISTWTGNPVYTRFIKKTLHVDDVNYTFVDDARLIAAIKKHTNYELPVLETRYHNRTDVIPGFSSMPNYEKHENIFSHVMLHYYDAFNAKYETDLDDYYQNYFGSDSVDTRALASTKYLEGLLWIFNHYFHAGNKLSSWYYPYLKAPYMNLVSARLVMISTCDFTELMIGVVNDYEVADAAQLMTPVEELLFITPLTIENLKILPDEYAAVAGQTFYSNRDIFPDVMEWVKQTWQDVENGDKSNIIQTREATTNIRDACLLELKPPDRDLMRAFFDTLPPRS